MAGLEFNIQANLGNTLTNLDKVQKELQETGKSSQKAANDMKPFARSSAQAGNAVTNLTRIISDAPFSVLSGNLIAVSNNIDPLIHSFRGLTAAAGGGRAAFQALITSLSGGAGLALAVSAITAAFTLYSARQSQAASETKKTKDELSELDKVASSVVKSVFDEAQKVGALVSALQEQNLTRKEQTKLVQELNKLSPEYFGNLDKEKNLVNNVAKAYFNYKQGISQAIQAKLIEADLNTVLKDLEEVEKVFKRLNSQEQTRQLIGGKPIERRGEVFRNEKGEVFDITRLLQRRAVLQSVILGLQKELNNADGSYVQQVIGGNEKIKERKDILEDYKNAIAAIVFREQAVGLDLIVSKSDLAIKTFTDLLEQGIKPTSREFQFINAEVNKFLSALPQLKKVSAELSSLDPTITNSPVKQRTAEDRFKKAETSVININPSAAARMNELLKKQKELNALAKTLENTFNSGINSAVDQFFNALANNQNPFDALIQSLKRLIVELGIAVVKAIALKAITSAITGGAGGGAAAGLLSGIGGFATGGFVSQPTLATIAENGPEFVLRPDQLGAIMNMGGGGSFQQVGVSITGEQLYILLQRTSSRKSRNF